MRAHSIRNCTVSIHCRFCQFYHHSLLHLHKNTDSVSGTRPSESYVQQSNLDYPNCQNKIQPTTSPLNQNNSYQNPAFQLQPALNTLPKQILDPTSQTQQCWFTFTKHTTVLLPTAEVEVKDIRGNFQLVRVLLDTGSMANLIFESCVNRLGLHRQNCLIPIQGINNLTSASTKGITQCFLKPIGKGEPSFTFEAIILPKVCSDHPKTFINLQNLSYIKGLPMADSKIRSPGPIDMLLGAELVPYMLGSSRVFGNNGDPVAIETVFGWILQGRAECSSNEPLASYHVSCEPQVDVILHKF